METVDVEPGDRRSIARPTSSALAGYGQSALMSRPTRRNSYPT